MTALEDRSVLAAGPAAPSDTYVVYAVAPETGTVTAVRLEGLTHPDLPAKDYALRILASDLRAEVKVTVVKPPEATRYQLATPSVTIR